MLATLIRKESVTDRDTLYVFQCPELAAKAKPGQFAELKLTNSTVPFLRRPISIFDCDGKNTVSFLVRTVGFGTDLMTSWSCQTQIDILGPLGNGFSFCETDQSVLLVGGGIGAAPLNYLLNTLLDQGKKVRFLYSPKRDDGILSALTRLKEAELCFAQNRSDVPIQLSSAINDVDRIYSCGPEGLLEAVANAANAKDIPCQLSMERRMGCGFGICVCCAIAINTEEGLTYKKVCKDGPVFSSREVSFHEKP